VLATLGPELEQRLGPAVVQSVQVKRWRYAGPVTPHPERSVDVGRGTPIVLCGDAFGGPKVEGAFLSGLDAARRVVAGDPT
ncbi:MAG: hypothetical protein AAFZ07_29455, partial [Actinomycetota bacterium]